MTKTDRPGSGEWPDITLVVMPFFRIGVPPLSVACLTGYLRAHGYDGRCRCLDLRLAENRFTSYVNTGYDALYAVEVPDLPLILGVVDNFRHQRSLLAGFDDLLVEYLATRPLSFYALKGELARIHDLAEAAQEELRQGEIICFTTYRSNFLATVICALLVRRRHPEALIVFGGPQVSQSDSAARLALKAGACDVVVAGEGEKPLLALARAYRDSGPLAVPGAMTLAPDGKGFMVVPPESVDLVELPCPDFSALELDRYPEAPSLLPVYSSRGCPFSCHFCNEGRMWRSFRQLPAARVVAMMAELHRRHGAWRFYFMDSLLNASRAWLEEFCDLLLTQGHDFLWYGYFRADTTPELVRLMKRAGLEGAFVGAESLSNRMLAGMNKKRQAENNQRALEDFIAARVLVQVGNVLGFPGETEEMFREHWQNVMAVTRRHPGACIFNYESFQFVPSCAIYDAPERFGLKVAGWPEALAAKVPELAEVVRAIPMAVSGSPSLDAIVRRQALFAKSFENDAHALRSLAVIEATPGLARGLRHLAGGAAVRIDLDNLSLRALTGDGEGGEIWWRDTRLATLDRLGRALFDLLDGSRSVAEVAMALAEAGSAPTVGGGAPQPLPTGPAPAGLVPAARPGLVAFLRELLARGVLFEILDRPARPVAPAASPPSRASTCI